jgi:hypothetical protein
LCLSFSFFFFFLLMFVCLVWFLFVCCFFKHGISVKNKIFYSSSGTHSQDILNQSYCQISKSVGKLISKKCYHYNYFFSIDFLTAI